MFNLVMFWTVRLVGEASNQIPSFANAVRSLKKVGRGELLWRVNKPGKLDAAVILRGAFGDIRTIGVAFIYLLAHL
jgi:hypothetical protein